jgi:hypothetical protein
VAENIRASDAPAIEELGHVFRHGRKGEDVAVGRPPVIPEVGDDDVPAVLESPRDRVPVIARPKEAVEDNEGWIARTVFSEPQLQEKHPVNDRVEIPLNTSMVSLRRIRRRAGASLLETLLNEIGQLQQCFAGKARDTITHRRSKLLELLRLTFRVRNLVGDLLYLISLILELIYVQLQAFQVGLNLVEVLLIRLGLRLHLLVDISGGGQKPEERFRTGTPSQENDRADENARRSQKQESLSHLIPPC